MDKERLRVQVKIFEEDVIKLQRDFAEREPQEIAEALEWKAIPMIRASHKIKIWRELVDAVERDADPRELLEGLRKKILFKARNPKRSSCPLSNLSDQLHLAELSEALDSFTFIVHQDS